MTPPSEPLYRHDLGQEPLPPAQFRRWPPPLLLLLALCILVELGAALFVLFGKPLDASDNASLRAYLLSSYQVTIVTAGMFLVIDGIAAWLVGDSLLRVAFILNIVIRVGSILNVLPPLAHWKIPSALEVFFYSSPFFPLFQLGLGIVSLASQICLSYGLARWHPSDKVFIWVQLLLTLGIGYALLRTHYLPPASSDGAFFIWFLASPFLVIAGVVCLLGRPACWKAQPLIVFCLTIGTVAALLFGDVIAPLLSSSFSRPNSFAIFSQQIFAVLSGISGILLVVGVLLLIQQQRRPEQVIAIQQEPAAL